MSNQSSTQTSLLTRPSELSHLQDAMKEVLGSDLQTVGTHRETLRELAKEFRFSLELNEVKQLRNERNELPFASPTRSAKAEIDGTPIHELGLKKATLEKCQSQVFGLYDERLGRYTSLGQGIETVEQLARISISDLKSNDFSDAEIKDIERNLGWLGFAIGEPSDDQESPDTYKFPLRRHDLFSDLNDMRDKAVIISPETQNVLRDDVALLPGISAETVTWLKRVAIQETDSGLVRNLRTIGDLVQLIVKLPQDWVGFDAVQANNYLLKFGLCLGADFSERTAEKLGISRVVPVAAEKNSVPIVDLENLMALDR